MTAEELAPFLDPPARSGDDEIEESYIVPALVRFGGSPEIDEQGNLVYRFESRSLVPSSTLCAAEFLCHESSLGHFVRPLSQSAHLPCGGILDEAGCTSAVQSLQRSMFQNLGKRQLTCIAGSECGVTSVWHLILETTLCCTEYSHMSISCRLAEIWRRQDSRASRASCTAESVGADKGDWWSEDCCNCAWGFQRARHWHSRILARRPCCIGAD